MKRILLLLPLLCVFFAGCGSYVEVENLIIVTGAAIDYDAAAEKYTVTAEILQLQDSGASDAGFQTAYLQSKGDHVASAVADLSRIAGHELYWNHADVFLLGRGVLETSVFPVLEWLMDDVNARLSSLVIAAGTESASDVYQLTSPVRKSVSMSLEQILRRYHTMGDDSAVTVNDLVNRCRNVGGTVCIPMVVGEQNGDAQLLVVHSYAILRGDTMAGVCEGESAVGLQLLLGHPVQEIIEVPMRDGSSALFRVGDLSASLRAGTDGNVPTAEVTVRAEVFSVGGETDSTEAEIRDAISAKFTELCEAVLKRDTSELHADVLGVGRELSRRHPDDWERLRTDWETAYGSLQYTVRPEILLKRLPDRHSPAVRGERSGMWN